MSENNLNYIMSFVTTAFGAIEFEQFKTIVFFILGLISFLISVAYTVYHWYKEAKKDGVITKDEISDLGKDVKDEIDDFIKKK